MKTALDTDYIIALQRSQAELLEALKEMVETYGDEGRNLGKAIQGARAAIAKAEAA